jgi:TPR repeat protein
MNSNQDNQQPLTPETQLEYFKILKYLARGAFGITYMALDTKRNRPVVIKEYFPSVSAFRSGSASQVSLLSGDHSNDYQEGLRRFKREAMTLNEFKHPNIVEVIAYFEANNTAYFVMEYVEGESLADKLIAKNGEPFTEAEINRDFLPILKGLKQIHSIDLLHLDIKPDNIIQTKFGEPLLIDFGGARFATGQASHDHSSMVATTGYAPPEQYSLSQEQTPASDIYAFGMTLYQLMTGCKQGDLPDSKDRQNALLENMPDPLKPIREVAKGYSETLYKIVEASTQIRKTARPDSVTSVNSFMFGSESSNLSIVESSICPVTQQENKKNQSFDQTDSSESNKDSQQNVKLTNDFYKQPQPKKKPWLLIVGLISSLAIGGVWYQTEQQKQAEESSRLVAFAELKEQERQSQEKVEAERKALEKAEAERKTLEKAEAERKALEKAEAERKTLEKAEAERKTLEKAEAERKALEKAEAERKALEKAESERKAKETELALNNSLDKAMTLIDAGKTEKAAKILIELAKNGNALAQTQLGILYTMGDGVQQNENEALYWLTKASDQGNPVAQNSLGVIYNQGNGVPRDVKKAEKLFSLSAKQDDLHGIYNLSALYLERKQYSQASKWLLKAAIKGNKFAQTNIAGLYFEGLGVELDYDKAFKWYKKAADAGDVEAQARLAVMYHKGLGVEVDDNKAHEWGVKSAQGGNLQSQYSLAITYMKGLGVPQDYDKSFKWMQKAALQGMEMAQYHVGMFYKDGKGVAQNYAEALKWLKRSDENGTTGRAASSIAFMYGNGDGVTQNVDLFLKYMKRSDFSGWAPSSALLGNLYYDGGVVDQDRTEALKYYKKACQRGLQSVCKKIEELQ